jgi:putative YphP/YqiW family bacilliredoxin
MRQELVAVGARECRTPADVDDVIKKPGVVMMVVNSVCGCAAGKARPGIAMALQHSARPSTVRDRCLPARTSRPPIVRASS